MTKTVLIFITIITLVANSTKGQNNIYISDTGDDLNDGSLNSPLKSLQAAHGKLLTLYPSKIVSQPVNIYVEGMVIADDLHWIISGSSQNQINITSKYLNSKGILTKKLHTVDPDNGNYLIHLDRVKYINFSHLIFNDATVGIAMASDYCTIKYCIFNCEAIPDGGGAGTISLGALYWTESLDRLPATHNQIVYNKIIGQGRSMVPTKFSLYQGIYIADAEYNLIAYNTIINPAGIAIQWYGTQTRNNDVSHNVIEMDYAGNTDDHLRHGLLFTVHVDDNEPWPSTYKRSESIINNAETGNYVSSLKTTTANQTEYASFSYSKCAEDHLVEKSWLETNNTCINHPDDFLDINNNKHTPNYYFYKDDALTLGKTTKDPFWLNFESNKIKDRIISGDFDSDGISDDIVGFYDLGNGSTQIHLWVGDSYKALDYRGPVTTLASFTATRINGRIVNGDFDNNGKSNDIAAFYANDDGTTDIAVFKALNTNGAVSFSASNWLHLSSFTANQISGKTVSGNFDTDSFIDDIATIYDNGNGTTDIFVFKSTNQGFTVSNYLHLSSFTGSRVTGTTVSGDFDNDSRVDDIAVIYDMGSSAEIFRFLYNGGSSFYVPSTSLLLSSFTGARIKGKTVSGNFDQDSFSDDIAVLYNNDNGSSDLFMYKWTPTGFVASTAWSGSAYESNQLSGKFISWNYVGGNSQSDILAFYDYSIAGESSFRTRTHVWSLGQPAWQVANNSLGFPWLLTNSGSLDILGRKGGIDSELVFENVENSPINVYPNPSHGVFHISGLKQFESYSIEIYNSQGQLIIKKVITDPTLNLEDFGSGFYYLKLNHNRQLITSKIVVK
jgi:hypothetical protein